MGNTLDHSLDCKACGTIYLVMPPDLANDAPVACSTCGRPLGLWRDLKADFRRQASQTEGVYDLHDGQFEIIPPALGPKGPDV